MQRKNNFLMPFTSTERNFFSKKMFTVSRNNFKGKRSGFAMIMAMGVIILVATIMLLSLNTTALTSKRTVDLYFYEQAELHAKSAIEYSLYQIATNGCQSTPYVVSNLDGIYDINITTRFIGTSASGCTDYITTLATPEQNGSVLMDVTVSIPANITGSEPIRYFRRTVQKL